VRTRTATIPISSRPDPTLMRGASVVARSRKMPAWSE
jgi:hypothetical protein